jgi:hypothetical protein
VAGVDLNDPQPRSAADAGKPGPVGGLRKARPWIVPMKNLAARKDFLGGALMLVLGLATAMQATSYDIGSLRRMGPGFFPLSLGIILGVVGELIIITAKRALTPAPAPEWRGWHCICADVGAFVEVGWVEQIHSFG